MSYHLRRVIVDSKIALSVSLHETQLGGRYRPLDILTWSPVDSRH